MTARGIRNNNPLNIRKGNNWHGERHPQTDREFEEFATMVDGIRAAMILAYNLITGRARSCHGLPCNTLDKLIARWAPPHENNTAAYLRHVAMAAGITTREPLYPIKKTQFCSVIAAMACVECGCNLDKNDICTAYALARLVCTDMPA